MKQCNHNGYKLGTRLKRWGGIGSGAPAVALVGSLMVLLGGTGCADSKRDGDAPSTPVYVFDDRTDENVLHLNLPPLQFNPEALARNPHLQDSALARENRISAETLLKALMLTTELQSPKLPVEADAHAEARQMVEAALMALPPTEWPEELTPQTIKERAVTEVIGGILPPDTVPRYNRDSTSFVDLVQEGSWQCASGSLLYGLTALRLPHEELRRQNLVLIYERGHVLPGYIRLQQGRLVLIGVEMTVLGRGQKYYGEVARLAEAGYALRIIMLPEALALQAAAPFLANQTEVAEHLLNQTAIRYGIPLREMEQNVRKTLVMFSKPTDPEETSTNPAPAVASPWAFGQSTIAAGDRKLMEVDRLNFRHNLLSVAELMALLPPDAERDDPLEPYAPDGEAAASGKELRRFVYPWDADYPGN